MNLKIAKEYTDEAWKDTRKTLNAAAGHSLTKVEEVPYILREQALSESIQTRRNLMVEASKHLGQILPKLNLAGEAATKAQDISKKLSPTATDAERFAAIESLKPVLTIEQRREMLRQAIALRNTAK